MRLIKSVLALVFALIAISFAVSNRSIVPVSIWPLPFEWPMPVALIGGIMLMIGFVLGGIAAWIGAGSSRSRARQAERKTREQAREISRLQEETGNNGNAGNASLAHHDPAAVDKAENKA